jgi:hypothetical protein
MSKVGTLIWTGLERFKRKDSDAFSTTSFDNDTYFFMSLRGPWMFIEGNNKRIGGSSERTTSFVDEIYFRNCSISNGPPNNLKSVLGGAGLMPSAYIEEYR